jgi:hypothetical protein
VANPPVGIMSEDGHVHFVGTEQQLVDLGLNARFAPLADTTVAGLAPYLQTLEDVGCEVVNLLDPLS